MADSKAQRAGILVRMPAPLKGALVRETARRRSNVNDVAAGILAETFGVSYKPSGRMRKVLAGASPVVLLRVPQELKDEIQAEASRAEANANDVILAALADGLGVPSTSNRKRKDTMASTNPATNAWKTVFRSCTNVASSWSRERRGTCCPSDRAGGGGARCSPEDSRTRRETSWP